MSDDNDQVNDAASEELAMIAGHAEVRGSQPAAEEPAQVPEQPAAEQQAEQPAEQPEEQPRKPTLEERLAAIEGNFPGMKQGLDSLAGRVGGINRTLQERLAQISSQPQATAAVKVTAEKLKKLSADYPELAASLADDLSEILQGAPQAAAPQVNVEALREEIEHSILVKTEKKALNREHPNWEVDLALKDEYGRPLRDPSGRYIPSGVFVEWLNSKPENFRKAFVGAVDADFLSSGLRDFKSYKASRQGQAPAQPSPQSGPAQAAQAPASKQARLASAITPQGRTAGGGGTTLSEDDAFVAGWKSVRG